MKIKFIDFDQLDRNMKATSHKSGKIGFTMDAAKKMELTTEKSVTIGINEEDASDNNLYVIVNNGYKQGAFKILKAGQYYYVNLKPLFDSLHIDYQHKTIVYDISREAFAGLNGYKFKRRETLNNKKDG
jgi:hypothetical protein